MACALTLHRRIGDQSIGADIVEIDVLPSAFFVNGRSKIRGTKC
jgi:hypothetical protein